VLEKGDRVLLPDPGWGVMRTVVERLGAVIDYYPLREGEQWIIDHDAILSRMNENTKLVVVNTPSNPTGATLSREGFGALLERAEKLGTFILSDEVYHNYVYEGQHVSGLSFDSLDNLIFVNSFSKAFAVTGGSYGRWGYSKKASLFALFPSASGQCPSFYPYVRATFRRRENFVGKTWKCWWRDCKLFPVSGALRPWEGSMFFQTFQRLSPLHKSFSSDYSTQAWLSRRELFLAPRVRGALGSCLHVLLRE